ncbi:MAG TPA: hypothetical protein VG435_02030, partial [Acidimicrobiales bacterium]|nr:hypothetical protein [Acidimicrobiales bacterium]
MGISSVFGLLGFGVILELIVPVGLGAIFIVVVVASRSEPDPTGLRPGVVYMLTTSFLSFVVGLIASVVTVATLASLIGRRVSGSDQPHAVGNQAARIVVITLLIAIASGIAFVYHGRKARLAGRHEIAVLGQPGTVLRIWQTYTAAVSFTC